MPNPSVPNTCKILFDRSPRFRRWLKPGNGFFMPRVPKCWNVRRKCSAAVSMFGGTSIRHLFFTITSLPLHCDNYWIVNYYYFSLFTEIAAELFAGHSNSQIYCVFWSGDIGASRLQKVIHLFFICSLFSLTITVTGIDEVLCFSILFSFIGA